MNHELQPAYVLHTRLYRDTSLLVEFFTEQQGRLSAVAKGARGPRSAWRGLLLPGVPLLITCKGKHDLLTLTQAESHGTKPQLHGNALLSQFYLNELLLNLLQRQDPHPELYRVYVETLQALTQTTQIEIPLRIFEMELLRRLGYGLNLGIDAATHEAVEPDQYYHLHVELGVVEVLDNPASTLSQNQQSVYQGKTLIALADRQLPNDRVMLNEAKRIMRKILDHILNGRAIKSRELFI
jgi:DNA repair protein RecO